MTGAALADEIETWLARNPDVSRMRFSVALRNQQSCYASIRRTASIGDETVERARKLMADKPADVLRRRPIGRTKPKRAKPVHRDPNLTNARRAQSIKAANHRRAVENIEAGRAATSTAIRITQRAVERQMADAARLTDPLEQAKLALRRAGFVVYSLSVHGGPADKFHVSGRGREEVSAQDLMALAEQAGRWAA